MPIVIRACLAALLALAAAPALAQSDAAPASSPPGWMTLDDYPPAAWRAGQEGRVTVLLSIEATGRVTDCAVTHSSGSALLDTTTCGLFRRRARFLPATDAAGTPIAGTYAVSRDWRLAELNAWRQKEPQAARGYHVYCSAIEPLRAGAYSRRVFLSALRHVEVAAQSYPSATMIDAWRVRLQQEGVGDDARLSCPTDPDKDAAWAARQWYLGRDAPSGFSTFTLDWMPTE